MEENTAKNTDRLSIKADRQGIVVYIPDSFTVNDICCQLHKRFLDNIGAFQKSGVVNVSFMGCGLTSVQADKIIEYMNSLDMLQVQFRHTGVRTVNEACLPAFADEDAPRTRTATYGSTQQRVDMHPVFSDKPYIFRGSISRRQTLEIRGNVIILGDVSRDATIISGKSITVIGELAGTAVAGRLAPSDSFITATDMMPRMLQIGRAKLAFPDVKKQAGSVAAIATNDNNSINITYI